MKRQGKKQRLSWWELGAVIAVAVLVWGVNLKLMTDMRTADPDEVI
jgi:Sec-independent protein translocase protein TatA